jgi:hypothetical protein
VKRGAAEAHERMITKIAPFSDKRHRASASRCGPEVGSCLLSGGPFSNPSSLFSHVTAMPPPINLSRRMMTRRLETSLLHLQRRTNLKRFCLIQLHRSTNEFTPRGLLHSYRSQLYARLTLLAEALKTCRAAQRICASCVVYVRECRRAFDVAFAPSSFHAPPGVHHEGEFVGLLSFCNGFYSRLPQTNSGDSCGTGPGHWPQRHLTRTSARSAGIC